MLLSSAQWTHCLFIFYFWTLICFRAQQKQGRYSLKCDPLLVYIILLVSKHQVPGNFQQILIFSCSILLCNSTSSRIMAGLVDVLPRVLLLVFAVASSSITLVNGQRGNRPGGRYYAGEFCSWTCYIGSAEFVDHGRKRGRRKAAKESPHISELL